MKTLLFLYDIEDLSNLIRPIMHRIGVNLETRMIQEEFPPNYDGIIYYPEAFNKDKVFSIGCMTDKLIVLLRRSDPLFNKIPYSMPLPPDSRFWIVPLDEKDFEISTNSYFYGS